MKATLDHVGIAVADLPAALAFYRDALGLEVEPPEEVASQQVRAHFIPLGESNLELLEATADDSPIAKYLDKRGPGIHHVTLRVEDVNAALERLKARGVRLIDQQPRPGAEGAMVAFIHPSSAHGVLVELKQPRRVSPPAETRSPRVERRTLGALELIALHDGFVHVDGGVLFGGIRKSFWSMKMPSDDRNQVTLCLRPLIIKGVRTMLVDAGLGDRESATSSRVAGDRSFNLDAALAEAGVAPEQIDIVLATHLHAECAGGFTVRDRHGAIRPRFPRARYVARRGEWEEATRPRESPHWNYVADSLLPLAQAGVLQLVDEDQTIMPGVRVQRTGGHTKHHQIVWIESEGQQAVYPADIVPTVAHLADDVMMGCDLYPMDTLTAKRALVREVLARKALVFLGSDPSVSAGHLVEGDGQPLLRQTP